MSLDGECCVLNFEDREVLADLAFEETKKLVESGNYKMGSREKIASELSSAFGLSGFDLEDIFYHVDNKYLDDLIRLGVIISNPFYKSEVCA